MQILKEAIYKPSASDVFQLDEADAELWCMKKSYYLQQNIKTT